MTMNDCADQFRRAELLAIVTREQDGYRNIFFWARGVSARYGPAFCVAREIIR